MEVHYITPIIRFAVMLSVLPTQSICPYNFAYELSKKNLENEISFFCLPWIINSAICQLIKNRSVTHIGSLTKSVGDTALDKQD